jgi:hypothetical protein
VQCDVKGTMLFGESTDHDTAMELLSTCMDHGMNFFDTAEMYPVPQRAETQGMSEQYLGGWLKQQRRCRPGPPHFLGPLLRSSATHATSHVNANQPDQHHTTGINTALD